MDFKGILVQLHSERERIERAITALNALNSTHVRNGKPTAAARRRGRRRMSTAARKRISQAMKRRWAKRKKSVSTA